MDAMCCDPSRMPKPGLCGTILCPCFKQTGQRETDHPQIKLSVGHAEADQPRLGIVKMAPPVAA